MYLLRLSADNSIYEGLGKRVSYLPVCFAAKVISGDKIDIFGKSYYVDIKTTEDNFDVPVIDILMGLFGGTGATLGSHGATASVLNANPAITAPIGDFLEHANRGTVDTKPRAYINYIFFDEQFNFADGGFSRVGDANALKDHFSDRSRPRVEMFI